MSGTDELECDLLVLGGGMAGMSAAGYAASRGANVIVLEKGPEIGGSAVLSGGWMWTAPSYEVLRDRAPRGDAEMQRIFLGRWKKAAEWIRSTGVEMSEERLAPPGIGYGYLLDILAYVQRCAKLVETAGGYVMRSTFTDHLIVDGGRVCGAAVRVAGESATIRAKNVVLATGGFQANRSMLFEQFGENSRQLLLRSNPHSSGDGLRLAREVGADVNGDFTTFYGHVIAWPLQSFFPKDFQRFSLSPYSMSGILLNLSCERYVDESFGHQWNSIGTAKQPQARAAVIIDDAHRAATTERIGGDKLADAAREGARVATVGSLSEAASTLAGWGFDPAKLAASVDAFNALVGGRDVAGQPPRKWNREPIGAPPYHLFEVRPGITTTQGGLRTDHRARVLDAAGAPIPGLFAAGGDSGGFYNGGYCGFLCVAATFGLSAVETILGGGLFDDLR